MALINCPECSKRISDQSTACPSCGFPTPSEQIDNNNLLASSRQRQKNSGCSGATIFLIIIIVLIGFWLVSAYDGYREKARQYNEEQSEPDKESPQVQESVFDSPLTQIPMLLSGSGEMDAISSSLTLHLMALKMLSMHVEGTRVMLMEKCKLTAQTIR